MQDSSVVRERRSQAERSSETRAKLLKAALELLIEVGYARFSTNDVAQRAGLSRGAQVHHFPLKINIVHAAIEDLVLQYSKILLARLETLPEGRAGVQLALKTLWEAYTSPLHDAYLELHVAARTDAEVRQAERAMLVTVVRPTLDRFCDTLAGPTLRKDKAIREKIEAAVLFVRALADWRTERGDAWCQRQLGMLTDLLAHTLQEAKGSLGTKGKSRNLSRR